MKNSEDPLLMREVELIVEGAADNTAQCIIDDILRLTERLKKLWPDARIRQTADPEGRYLHSEIDRINRTLQDYNGQFVLLHNQQLETATSFIRPNAGNPPE